MTRIIDYSLNSVIYQYAASGSIDEFIREFNMLISAYLEFH